MKKIYLLSILFASCGLASAQSFWCKVPYMGAFGTGASADWTKGWSNFDPNNATYAPTDSTISAGDITSKLSLSATKTYLLDGFIYVKSNTTLTIAAGTVLRGKKGSKSTIIVTKGSKIIANGTVSKPIVLTSDQAAGSRDYGDWGGIIMLGKAPVNPNGGVATIEGGVNNANNDGAYGGTDTLDNSGSLKYVRIEFGGVAFQPNNEINGLTLGGIGRGTTLEFIQISYSGDDAFEWFGGNVDAKWLISHRSWDDDFDTDFGFSGRVQFGMIIRDPKIADISGSNGFESDNDGTGSDNAPYTRCVFSNITAVGAGGNANINYAPSFNANHKRGMHIRRNSRHSLVNSIMIGYSTGLLMDSKKTFDRISDSTSTIKNNYFVYCKKAFDTVGTKVAYPTLDIAGWATSSKNMKIDSLVDIKLGSFSLTSPNLLPQTGSPALTGANFGFAKLLNNTVCVFGAGIESVFGSNASFKVFPNPSQGSLQLSAEILKPVSATLQVIDLTGKTVYSSNLKLSAGKFNEKLNLSGLNNGFYLVRLVSGNQSISSKVSINK